MADSKVVSLSGAEIVRHEPKDRDWEPPEHEARNLADIEAHLEKYIGKVDTVLHELVSDRVHLDVLHIAPSGDRPFHLFVTSGMSDLPMQVPDDMQDFARAELLVTLPAEWPVSQDAFQDENNYWPLRWLKQIGRLPHEFDTWLGWGHSIPNGDPPEKIANTNFTGVCLAPPYWLDAGFFQLRSGSGDTVSFYELIPVYREEMQLKLDQGFAALEKALEQAGTGFVIDLERPNVV